MIDHLLQFDDEAAARAALPAYWTPASDDGPGAWRGDVCIPGISVYVVSGTEEITDEETRETYTREIRTYHPGWFIIIAFESLNETFKEGENLRLATNREAAVNGQPFIVYVAPDVSQEVLVNTKIEPTFAGSNYPFGNPQVVEEP